MNHQFVSSLAGVVLHYCNFHIALWEWFLFCVKLFAGYVSHIHFLSTAYMSLTCCFRKGLNCFSAVISLKWGKLNMFSLGEKMLSLSYQTQTHSQSCSYFPPTHMSQSQFISFCTVISASREHEISLSLTHLHFLWCVIQNWKIAITSEWIEGVILHFWQPALQ